jgi:hypothetical protein
VSVSSPLVGAFLFEILRPHHDMEFMGALGILLGGCFGSIVGVIAAVVAAVRNEQRGWLTAIGFLINMPLAGLTLALAIS